MATLAVFRTQGTGCKLNNFSDRMESVERILRLHAQTLAHVEEDRVRLVQMISSVQTVDVSQVHNRLALANATIVSKFEAYDKLLNDRD